jgi:hypothetical protein
METGAPEPLASAQGDTLWIAYRARDPSFPGWESPTALEYLHGQPEGEPFAVLRFDGVTHHHLGPPGDERLQQHPLWGHGLDYYSFHRLADDGTARWIVTFHDETLEVTARQAWASPITFASNAAQAIEKARRPHETG